MEKSVMSRNVLIALGIVAGIALSAGALWLGKVGTKSESASSSLMGESSATAGENPSAAPVDTVRIERQDLQRISDSTPGNILAFETTNLYAKISGFLIDIQKDIGDPVAKDEVLARISIPELDKELDQKKALVVKARADVKQADAAVLRAQADLKRTKSQSERLDLIRRTGGTLSKEDAEEARLGFEAAQASVAKAEADVEVAKARLQVAEADRQQVEAMLQYTKIVAPYKGVVTKRNLHTGAFTNAHTSEQPLIFSIARTDKLRLTVDIPETDVRFLDVMHPEKHKVSVKLDAFPDKKFVWTLTRFAPVLNEGKKVRAEIHLDNPVPDPDDPSRRIYLYPGMYAHAAVILQEKPGALTLPVACLSQDDKGTYVYKVVNGKAKKQYVRIDLNDGIKAEITLGLAGDAVVIAGGKNIVRDGQAVLVK
jgi:RND family efflux transporter MFP subunit